MGGAWDRSACTRRRRPAAGPGASLRRLSAPTPPHGRDTTGAAECCGGKLDLPRLPRLRISKLAWLVAVLLAVAGCGQAPRSAAPTPAEVRAAFAGSPARLAALHSEGGLLLPASTAQFKAVLSGLRGYPAVVNLWGSWCPPCRSEFPIFQRAAVVLGRRVAFVGLDVSDAAGDARAFLRRFPTTYPSYADPGAHTAFALKAGAFFPTTEFYDRTGKLAYTHEGQYFTLAQLESDVRTYAGA
jgi:cytochrome c biogenesis protein CcmG/thiol:disulfide interchange protein DsbE